ncbi:MAG: flagellin [Alphaproteobacteria bacterium]|nr:flagellin [Alphaproteobacteria bacterium]
MTTIHTNPGALVAQATLRTISTQLDRVSKQVQTGYKVADAKDDASTFAVAQGLRGNLASLVAVQQGLSGAVGLAEVGLAGATAVSNLFEDIRTKLTQLADTSITAIQRATYSTDLKGLAVQAKNLIKQAKFNGTNLLDNAVAMNFIADVNGVTIGVSGVDVFTSASTFNASIGASVTSTLARTFLNASSNTLDLFIANTNTALSGIAGDLRAVEAQNNFTKAISDATEKGLGALVDADLAKASSRLQALQAQQQLATQAITIANQAPAILLSLFK